MQGKVSSDVITAFHELEAQHRTPPRGAIAKDGAAREAFRIANVELYHIAQAIAERVAPQVQSRLQMVRRQVVSYIATPQARQIPIGSELRPAKLRRPIRWCEIMLTPELENDLSLSGSKVPYSVATELRTAHRAQIDAVRKAVGI